jgi:hypothetical protein
MNKKFLLLVAILFFLFVFPVNVNASNYTVSGSLGRFGIDFWRISSVTKGDIITVTVSVTSKSGWTSEISNLNLTVIDTQNGLGTHNIRVQANETGDLLLKIVAPSTESMTYNIASSHLLTMLPTCFAGASLANGRVSYWTICNVTKGDLVSIVIGGNWVFGFWTVLSYPNLGVADSQNSNGAHVIQFYAKETGDMQLKVTAPGSEGMAYDLKSTHPIELENSLIESFSPDKAVVNQGELATFSVVLTNLGIKSNEVFNVSLSSDSAVIQTITLNGSNPFETKNLKFQWDTTGVQPGNHTLSIQISTPTNGQEWSPFPFGEYVIYVSNALFTVKSQFAASQSVAPTTSPFLSTTTPAASLSPSSSSQSLKTNSTSVSPQVSTSATTSGTPLATLSPTLTPQQTNNQTQSSSPFTNENQYAFQGLVLPMAIVLALVGVGSGTAIFLKTKGKKLGPKKVPVTSMTAPIVSASNVFISHVEEDEKVAIDIASALEQKGYKTWYYERDSIPGTSYLLTTGQAIEQAKAVILIISRNSLRSNQVHAEVVATFEAGIPFLPILNDITHQEFQQSRPDWRRMLASSTSIAIPREGVSRMVPRLIAGLTTLDIPKREGFENKT